MINTGFFINRPRKPELSKCVYILKSVAETQSVLSVSRDFGATFMTKTINHQSIAAGNILLKTCESGKFLFLLLSDSSSYLIPSVLIYSRDYGSTFHVMATVGGVQNIQVFNDGLAAFYYYDGDHQIKLSKDYSLQTYDLMIEEGVLMNRASRDEILIVGDTKYLFNVYNHQVRTISLNIDRYQIAGNSHFCFMTGDTNIIYRSAYGMPTADDYDDISNVNTLWSLALLNNGLGGCLSCYKNDVGEKFSHISVGGGHTIANTTYAYGAYYGFYHFGNALDVISFNAIGCNGSMCFMVSPNGDITVLTTGLQLALNANYTNN